MPYTTNTDTSEGEEEHEDICKVEEIKESVRDARNMQLLKEYVEQMSYRPGAVPVASKRTEQLAKPRKRTLAHTAKYFAPIMEPPERRARIRGLAAENKYITLEQFQKILKKKRAKEKNLQQRQLRRETIYYDLMEELESRCRSQYLNVMIKKFADFISKLATTMSIPDQLVDPYARMHRGLFCNILTAIGLKPIVDPCMYRSPEEIINYEVSNKLAHALLSLIIKALDEAVALEPDEICMEPVKEDEWEQHIKKCLKCAAEKKCRQEEKCKRKADANKFANLMKKCQNFDECYQYL